MHLGAWTATRVRHDGVYSGLSPKKASILSTIFPWEMRSTPDQKEGVDSERGFQVIAMSDVQARILKLNSGYRRFTRRINSSGARRDSGSISP